MKRLALFAIPFALLATACGPDYDHTNIDGVVTGKLGGTVDLAHVTVPEGTLVKAHIVSYNTDRKTMPMDIHSADETVLLVRQVVSGDDYAFLGLKPGRTTVELKADGDTVLVLDAIVTQQPATP